MVKKFDEFFENSNNAAVVEEQLVTDICSYENNDEPVNESAAEIFQAILDWGAQTHVTYDGEVMTYASMLASTAISVAMTAPIWVRLLKFIVIDGAKEKFKNKKLQKAADKILANDKIKDIVVKKLADDEEVKKYKEDNTYKPDGGWSKYFVENVGADVIQKIMEEVAKEAPDEVAKLAAAKL